MLDFPRRNSTLFPITFWLSIRTFSRLCQTSAAWCVTLLIFTSQRVLPFSPPSLFSLALFLFFVSSIFALSPSFRLATWLKLRSIPDFSRFCIEHHGPCSRSCISSPFGSGHYAFEPLGWSTSFLRTLYWMGRSNAYFTVSLGTSHIQRPPHVWPRTFCTTSTHNGITWRHSITYDCESWTEPTSFHNESFPSWGRRPHSRFGQYNPKSCSHRRAHRYSSSRNINRPGTSSSYYPDHNTGSCSGQNNVVPLPRKTHNRRKNRNQRRVHNPPLALCLFPSSPNSHVMASTLMTRMMMQHPEPLPHMIIQPTTSVEIPPYHPPSLPLHHQALQRQWFWHQIPLSASCNLRNLLVLQVTHHTDPGRTQMIKSWSISKNDTKSRPSWKTIGARLRRDPQVCKLRWGILKQTDPHGHVHPPHEPEAED